MSTKDYISIGSYVLEQLYTDNKISLFENPFPMYKQWADYMYKEYGDDVKEIVESKFYDVVETYRNRIRCYPIYVPVWKRTLKYVVYFIWFSFLISPFLILFNQVNRINKPIAWITFFLIIIAYLILIIFVSEYYYKRISTLKKKLLEVRKKYVEGYNEWEDPDI